MYHYWAYGLTVSSELEFPELFRYSFSDTADVIIKIISNPSKKTHKFELSNSTFDISFNEFLLKIDGVACYYATNGSEINIEMVEDASIDIVRLFCLSNAFAAILYQRKIIPLHCSALLFHDKLVMIMGDSGAGKSTTMALLMQKGLQPFSDDVCVPVKISDEKWGFYSSFPMMKFWGATLEMPEIKLSPDRRIRDGMDKYGVYFHDLFCYKSKIPLAIFIIQVSSHQVEPSLSRIGGINLFKELDRNRYRGEYLVSSDLQKDHFNFISQLANQVTCYNLNRPEGLLSQELVSKLIYEELINLLHE